jgi:hypothetical protein
MSTMTGKSATDLAAGLRELAEDRETLWNVARKAIEDELVDWRDRGLFTLRNNGFTIKFEDGEPSDVIRFGPEAGVRIALLALADHLEKEKGE